MRRFALLLAGSAVLTAAWLAARRWTDVVAVRGRSMAPTLLPGEQLLVERWSFARRPPRAGEVVLARDPRQPGRELIKRVRAVDGAHVELRGDGATSSDSRTFGAVPLPEVQWRVALRYWPVSRLGPLPPPPLLPAGPPAPLSLLEQGGEPACIAFGDLVTAFDED